VVKKRSSMKSKTKKLLVITAVFAVGLTGAAKADLATQIDACLKRPSQKKVQYAIHIVKGDSGQTLYSHNVNKAMVPASNMKIIVTVAALKCLGPDYEYKTRVGLCDDTLAIIGSGDPLLGDETTDAKYDRKVGWLFDDIAAVLKHRHITTIKDIIIDTSVFDDQGVHPNWPKEQLNRWYACEVSGLNYNDNCIDITTKTVNGRVVISVEPATDFVKIVNKVIPVRKGKRGVGAYRQPNKPNNLVIKGRCKEAEGPFAVAIERPAAFFGFLLAENLGRAGISVKGQLTERPISADCNFTKLAEYSTPIADCITRCNKNSLQLAAEALVKTIAAKNNADGKNGSWKIGREVIHNYLLGLGLEEKEFYADDGSGLSRENKLSANAITKVLLDVYKSKNWQLYKESLAVGGVDGTIGRYFKDQKYKGKVFGKTGYIGGVRSFSGLCTTEHGDYIFSILANKSNGKSRETINDIVKAIFDN